MSLSPQDYASLAELGPPGISHVAEVEAVDPAIHPLTSEHPRAAGPAYPVTLPTDDAGGVSRAILEAPAGSVLVIRAPSETNAAVFGGLSAIDAARAQLAAIVVDGRVCDLEEIADVRIPVFARGLSPIAMKLRSLEAPYSFGALCGGVNIERADVVVGGPEGLVVFSEAVARDVLAQAPALLEREQTFKHRMSLGTPLWKLAEEMLGK